MTPVLGGLKDLDLLEELVSKAHVVFSCVRSRVLISAQHLICIFMLGRL